MPLRPRPTSAYRGQAQSIIWTAFSVAKDLFFLGSRKSRRTRGEGGGGGRREEGGGREVWGEIIGRVTPFRFKVAEWIPIISSGTHGDARSGPSVPALCQDDCSVWTHAFPAWLHPVSRTLPQYRTHTRTHGHLAGPRSSPLTGWSQTPLDRGRGDDNEGSDHQKNSVSETQRCSLRLLGTRIGEALHLGPGVKSKTEKSIHSHLYTTPPSLCPSRPSFPFS